MRPLPACASARPPGMSALAPAAASPPRSVRREGCARQCGQSRSCSVIAYASLGLEVGVLDDLKEFFALRLNEDHEPIDRHRHHVGASVEQLRLDVGLDQDLVDLAVE